MFDAYAQLADGQLSDIKNLIAECEEFDGAKACVQLDHSLNCDRDIPSWFLEYDGIHLIAIGSVFSPLTYEAELSICVKPESRRKGHGKALFTHIQTELATRGVTSLLIVCDSNSKTGERFIDNIARAKLHHSEFGLYLDQAPLPDTLRLDLAKSSVGDIEEIVRICMDAFEEDEHEARRFIGESLQNQNRVGYIGKSHGEVVCLCFLGYEDRTISINTVAVKKEMQGQGYGKELLLRIIDLIKVDGAKIVIDVDSDNAVAYNLYLKAGFKVEKKIDYHALIAIR